MKSNGWPNHILLCVSYEGRRFPRIIWQQQNSRTMDKFEIRCFLYCFQSKQFQETCCSPHWSSVESPYYTKCTAGDTEADQYVAKCFNPTFIMFNSDDNIICMSYIRWLMCVHVRTPCTHRFSHKLLGKSKLPESRSEHGAHLKTKPKQTPN